MCDILQSDYTKTFIANIVLLYVKHQRSHAEQTNNIVLEAVEPNIHFLSPRFVSSKYLQALMHFLQYISQKHK